VDKESLRVLLGQGLSVERIAERFGKHPSTISYWMAKHGLHANNREKHAAKGGIKRERLGGLTPFVLDTRGCYRCRRCRSEAVTRRRRRVKQILIAEAGGCCQVCGYDRHPAALAFHHLDPTQKRLVVSARGVGLSLDTLRAEAQKCVLLCANCHAEVESGALAVPIDSGEFEAPELIHLNPG
jgi:hypothetical protein